MAKREADKDRPLILDDVVVSFDRSHRGMIVQLLEKEFSGRQVVIMTHDREWYAESGSGLTVQTGTLEPSCLMRSQRLESDGPKRPPHSTTLAHF